MNGSPFNSSRSSKLPASPSRIPWSGGVDCTFGTSRSLLLAEIELPVSGLCRLITGVRQNVRPRFSLFGNKPLPPPRTPLPTHTPSPPPSRPAMGFKCSPFPTSAGNFTKVLFGNAVKNPAAYQQVELFAPPKVWLGPLPRPNFPAQLSAFPSPS